MAIRTNSKKAHENIARYILEWCADEVVEANEWYAKEGNPTRYNPESITDVCRFIIEQFAEQYSHNIKRYGAAAAFQGWAAGLPLGGLFCYYYNRSAVDDLGDILEESEAERHRFTESEAEKCLTSLIFAECYRQAKH